MERQPEPDLMDEEEQARAYALADFEAPHENFVELFKQRFAGEDITGDVLDLGCGPADVSIRFARHFPGVSDSVGNNPVARRRVGRLRLGHNRVRDGRYRVGFDDECF